MKNFGLVMILLFSLTSFSQTTTFIVLRHAEKADNTKDTYLSADGLTRADELRKTLSPISVEAIYSTPFNRTKQTVTPLATAKGIAVTEYPANKPYEEFVNELIAAYRGKTVVIVGHSNTVPEILKALSNNTFNVTINENQFDNLFVVTLTDGKQPEVAPMKYGKSTP